jgi:hypothetical protein
VRFCPRRARVAVGHRAAHVLLPVCNLSNTDRLAGEDDRRRQALGEDDFDAMAPKCLRNALRDSFSAHDNRLS